MQRMYATTVGSDPLSGMPLYGPETAEKGRETRKSCLGHPRRDCLIWSNWRALERAELSLVRKTSSGWVRIVNEYSVCARDRRTPGRISRQKNKQNSTYRQPVVLSVVASGAARGRARGERGRAARGTNLMCGWARGSPRPVLRT